MDTNVSNLLKSGERRRRVAIRERRVECEYTGRSLQFSGEPSGLKVDSRAAIAKRRLPSDMVALDVLTSDTVAGQTRKLCGLVVSVRDVLLVMEEITGEQYVE